MSFVTKENTEDIYPLSPTQKGMLFHALYDDATPLYHEQIAFTINGPLDVTALKASWLHLVAMNPVLRTVFKWAKVKEPLQIVLKNLPMGFQTRDLAHLDHSAQQAASSVSHSNEQLYMAGRSVGSTRGMMAVLWRTLYRGGRTWARGGSPPTQGMMAFGPPR